MILVLLFFGLLVGSFLNILIDRLPIGQDVIRGRSRCDHCGKTLRWYELIPLLSFIFQKGRCRRCHKKLSLQYPLIELITGFLFVFFVSSIYVENTSMYRYIDVFSILLIVCSLLVILVSDFKYQIIPDSMVLLGIVGSLLLKVLTPDFPLSSLLTIFYPAFGASLFFVILFLISRGRSIGFGDVKLGFLMGLLLGYPLIVVALYVAFLTGAIVGVILIITKKKSLKSAVPFGPFLIIGTVSALVWGDRILSLWRGLL